jgi:hypothetical protein
MKSNSITGKSRPKPIAGILIDLKTTHYFSICASGEISEDHLSPVAEDREAELVSGSVCAFCKRDFEGIALDKISVYPICEGCKTDLNNKTFPLWVKLFFGGVIVLVLFSVFWNWRFYDGYINTKAATSAYVAGDVTKAALLMTKAAKDVPEATDIGSLAHYFSGIDLLKKDKSTEALSEFDGCKNLPADYHVNTLVLQAEMGSGYDKKDYGLFLTAAKAFLQSDTTHAQSWAGVSSAYACLYAQNNADSSKQQALKYYYKAKTIDDKSAEAKEFYGRILYRLDSRQIISKDEFDKKFPNGYISNNLK